MTINIDAIVASGSDEPPEQHTCYHCNCTESEIWYSSSRGKLCEGCGSICPDCDGVFNLQSGAPHAYWSDEFHCYRCARQNFFMCPDCDEWERDSYGTHVPNHDGYVCEGCLNNNYWWCDDCDTYVPEHWDHDGCGMSDLIHDYSYKPMPIFHHTDSEYQNAKSILEDTNSVMRKYKQIAYLGFELEVECLGDRNSYRDGARLFDNSNIWYLKSDGSLNYGFEIVSHPMTLDWAMANLDWDTIDRLGDMSFAGWEAGSAGLHVHVSRDGFASESHQAKFVHFIMRNEPFLSWLAGRSNSRWASFNPDHRKNLKNKLRNSGMSERYFAVNLQNSGTLEVRIFRASLKPQRVQMALQLVDAIVKYTQTLSVSEMVNGKGFNASSFITWVSADSRYAVLSDYITRWLEPFESGSQQIGE